MPDRDNASSWIRHLLGKHITEETLSAARDLHMSGLHEDDKSTRVKVKPAAQHYFARLAIKKLTLGQINKLVESHEAMKPHALDPENEQKIEP